ncbi:helix-turn-helix transcriptional regulator [Subsaxibacter sp. CAU 1640]|uniref:helix-turn-helix domain-containing protein n=1 Tax=Subsaxibacter sp. CAU 1640 TaxID=2933271 RepID=UPI002004859E|nr:helix-turn-helix domain-containing protein [Subsaxibacter sp. CAU 1640]MCK7591905.1 helix-turn-helix transcriptional regulator [Subsaxibacter sp. CAU 1640]
MESVSVKAFYQEVFGKPCNDLSQFLEQQNGQNIGHFNVFDIEKLKNYCSKGSMPYNRRSYYKISLIIGENRVEYADKVIDIKDSAILFATPKIPYRYVPLSEQQTGHFCVFTPEFLLKSKTGFNIDKLPVFQPQSNFIYQLAPNQVDIYKHIFKKMHEEMSSDYPFKYDLLRNQVMELILQGQKLEPMAYDNTNQNASTRIFTLFIELLERQFPIESTTQSLQLKTAKDFANTLRVHVNHLNKVLKESTGKTTTEIIASRVTQEAKVLLRQTSWNISEIAYSLGFDEVSNFSNFFKKNTDISPMAFRE